MYLWKPAFSGNRLAAEARRMIEGGWLSIEENAAYFEVKRDTIYKWIERKAMPAHKVGRLWEFRKEEDDQWVRVGETNDRVNDKDSVR